MNSWKKQLRKRELARSRCFRRFPDGALAPHRENDSENRPKYVSASLRYDEVGSLRRGIVLWIVYKSEDVGLRTVVDALGPVALSRALLLH